jgi:nucleotide-binding universal stress UspA family protein
MISKILVPVDGSATALKAAKYAMGLAKLASAQITLVSVLDSGPFVSATVASSETPTHLLEPLSDYLKQAAETYMAEIEALGKETGIEVTKVIRWGHPVEEILKEAGKSKADLIVIGSHGKSAFEAAFLGSVAFGVLHKDSKIPVLVVRK